MEKKSCFIIMPFTKTTVNGIELTKRELDHIYKEIIRKVVLEYKDEKIEFSQVNRNDANVGSLISNIISSLNQADLVIADLSGLNPNVMYELGVRHTLKRGTIIITQDIESLPSDLRGYMCVDYSFSKDVVEQTDNYDKFKNVLHKTISEIFATEKSDSPVLSYLSGKERYWKEDEIKKLKGNTIIVGYILDQYINIQELIKEIVSTSNIDVLLGLFGKLGAFINNIANAIADIYISIEDSILYEDIQAAKQLISDIQKKIALTDYFATFASTVTDKDGPNLQHLKLSFFNEKYLDYFRLSDGEFCDISLNDIFSDDGDFYQLFISGFEEYLERMAKELKISETEIVETIDAGEE